jgi:hypothetical protein
MSDLPERIWAWERNRITRWARHCEDKDSIEYIRKEVSDALVAAAYEDAAAKCQDEATYNKDLAIKQYESANGYWKFNDYLFRNLHKLASEIRSLMPFGSQVALDRIRQSERENAFLEAYQIVHLHKGFRAAKAWSEDEREGYQNGQIDMQTALSNALLAIIKKESGNE